GVKPESRAAGGIGGKSCRPDALRGPGLRVGQANAGREAVRAPRGGALVAPERPRVARAGEVEGHLRLALLRGLVDRGPEEVAALLAVGVRARQQHLLVERA